MGFVSPLNCSRLKLETHWLSGDWGNCSELANDLLWNDTMQETVFLLIIFSHSIFLNQTHSWKKWTLKERDYLSALGKSIIWVTYLQSSARWLHLFTLFYFKFRNLDNKFNHPTRFLFMSMSLFRYMMWFLEFDLNTFTATEKGI